MKDYTYSVARVRAKEASLLSKQDIEQLISSENYSDALRVLTDKGYGMAEAETSGSITEGAERELWKFLAEISDEMLLRLLRLPKDYHNLKAAVKAVYSGAEISGLLNEGGSIDGDIIRDCIEKREYKELPPFLADTAETAMSLLLKTQDGQLCDIYIDNAMLAETKKAALEIGNELIIRYAVLITDTSNLKAALRCAVTGKNEEFASYALADGGSLNRAALAAAAGDGKDALYAYTDDTVYSEGTEYMKCSGAAFEKWCDDRIMSLVDEARYQSFSSAPILAYAYAKQTELKAVRLILSAKKNMLDSDIIRERVRRLYV